MPALKATTFIEIALINRDEDCVLWPFGFRGGYPCVQVAGKRFLVPRYVCGRAYGPPPTPKHQAAHLCNDKRCINPRHLCWSTAKENGLDVVIRKLTSLELEMIRRWPAEADLTKRLAKYPKSLKTRL